ncbi:hypothetical protein HELRODRAFT_163336 [Helobdella robusta]|uniref:Uncharacterized protein n=1 Tax=Helobdella robusta TaxID=6412 RepID=T1ETX5_HELRO|nr:hypothetical protein HELRODRAFT_163336 [Helobdella robusta]ESN96287.1 hypothetical protein HELRODRAFT_163336 [Helobdella robusta]
MHQSSLGVCSTVGCATLNNLPQPGSHTFKACSSNNNNILHGCSEKTNELGLLVLDGGFFLEGCLIPILALVTVITNSIVCLVLTSKEYETVYPCKLSIDLFNV